ncbi:MAG: thioredoxin [Fastidiosipilaceae bacterium]|nr:thioredoxin [Clostridiaceae bacterium]
MTVIQVNSSNFDSEVLQSDVPVLVDFFAEWCGPCKMMSPILDELANEVGAKAKVAKINVDENPELSQQFNVMSVPTLYVVKNGEVVNKVIGARPKAELLKLLGL